MDFESSLLKGCFEIKIDLTALCDSCSIVSENSPQIKHYIVTCKMIRVTKITGSSSDDWLQVFLITLNTALALIYSICTPPLQTHYASQFPRRITVLARTNNNLRVNFIRYIDSVKGWTFGVCAPIGARFFFPVHVVHICSGAHPNPISVPGW
jgi:hypothetical protein